MVKTVAERQNGVPAITVLQCKAMDKQTRAHTKVTLRERNVVSNYKHIDQELVYANDKTTLTSKLIRVSRVIHSFRTKLFIQRCVPNRTFFVIFMEIFYSNHWTAGIITENIDKFNIDCHYLSEYISWKPNTIKGMWFMLESCLIIKMYFADISILLGFRQHSILPTKV